MDSVSVSDLLAVDGADYPGGTYRVVGTDDDTVTALRIGGVDGRRIHTGEVVTIDRDELDGFAPADPPDSSRSLADSVASVPATAYWSVRALASQLRDRPVPGGLAVTLFVAGAIGGPVLPVSELVLDAMVLVGGLGLAAIGSGRM